MLITFYGSEFDNLTMLFTKMYFALGAVDFHHLIGLSQVLHTLLCTWTKKCSLSLLCNCSGPLALLGKYFVCVFASSSVILFWGVTIKHVFIYNFLFFKQLCYWQEFFGGQICFNDLHKKFLFWYILFGHVGTISSSILGRWTHK